MTPADRKLGMHRSISRRDFIHDLGLASLGLSLPPSAWSDLAPTKAPADYYPPTRTGLRGSHPGSFEVAHALAMQGKLFDHPRDLDESYDLIVAGGGLSGLAAAYFYRKLHGAGARILILDNHDDFGGQAKRNEFHQGGPMQLAFGGTVNMEYTKFSATAKGLLDELGVDIARLRKDSDFDWRANSTGLQPAIWFDQETYGRDVLLPGVGLGELPPGELAEYVSAFPIPQPARQALRRFLQHRGDVLEGKSRDQKRTYLRTTSYQDFLREHFALPDEAVQVFSAASQGFWGVRAENLSVAECLLTGLPGAHVLGDFEQGQDESFDGPSPSAMFPDGNASIARLLVRALIPGAFHDMGPAADPFSIVTADLDYGRLDLAASPVRMRLNATVVQAANAPNGHAVAVSYVRGEEVEQVRGRHCVLACYNNIIPSLCPELPDAQKDALRQCIRRPMLVVNVAMRSGRPLQRSGISSAYLPGRLCQIVMPATGVNVADYEAAGLSISEQNRAGQARLLGMSFAEHEREVRTVLQGIWGRSGLDPAEDILAITVNRWPHGYARDHLDLEDPAWNAEPPPNEVGRQPIGNIAIANSDAGADAYTHTAFDQAWRAVNELPA
jgi:spermidine dehydrogenase